MPAARCPCSGSGYSPHRCGSARPGVPLHPTSISTTTCAGFGRRGRLTGARPRLRPDLADGCVRPGPPTVGVTLLEGLDGGRSAFVTKLHHCLADGIAGVQIAALVVDADASMPAIEPLGPRSPSTAQAGRPARGVSRRQRRAGRSGWPLARRAARSPRRCTRCATPASRLSTPGLQGRPLARMLQPVDRHAVAGPYRSAAWAAGSRTVQVPMTDVRRRGRHARLHRQRRLPRRADRGATPLPRTARLGGDRSADGTAAEPAPTAARSAVTA